MKIESKLILELHEIKNGYLLNITNQYGEDVHTESFQWSATNDQRQAMVQQIINRLGTKHDLELKSRR